MIRKLEKNNQQVEPAYFSEQVAEAHRFYRNPKESSGKGKGIYVVGGGREQCAPGYEIHRPTFPFYSIEFVAGGKGTLILGKEKYNLSPGIIFSYGPGIKHEIYSFEEDPLEKHFVNFTGEKAVKILREGSFLGKTVLSSAPNHILDTFNDITRYGLSHSRYNQQICGTLVELLVLQIADSALTSHDAGSPAFATYQHSLDIINSRYKKLNSLNEIAEVCNVDAAYLCRLFKRFGHQTPYRHLTLLKMNSAAELLLEPGMLIKEVAYELGFDDQFHFSRTFKRIFDVSPKAFIRLHQGEENL